MQLDSEKQKEMLLTLINNMTFSGKLIDETFYLKQAIITAKVTRVKEKPLKEGRKNV